MLCALLFLSACAPSSPVLPTVGPDLGKRLVAENGMVAAAHPLASEAGVEMLRRGGNAVDAAVAAAFAVGVVEPMMSGLGGGGGMVIWLQDAGRAEYVDFYASAGADPDTALRSYEGPSSTPRGVAIPGSVAGLLAAHERFGVLPRAEVLAPAIRIADEGFPVHGLLARVIAGDSAKLVQYPGSQRIFWPDYEPLAAGERLVQTELAATLRRIADEGPDGFYEGEVAREIVEVLNAGSNPVTLDDFAAYEARWRRPMCGEYRDWLVLSAPPPQSGMQVIETLNLLEPFDLAELGYPTRSPDAFRVLASAIRVARADRNAYVGDPDHATVPAAEIASEAYADQRAALVGDGSVPEEIGPGDPRAANGGLSAARCAALEPFGPAGAAPVAMNIEDDPDEGSPGETTHLSVADRHGNAVSLTYTQGLYFGTGTWAAGTFLNSAMFNFAESDTSANALGPWHVPASTIAPTLVLEDGRVRMVVGSPASGRIPPAVVETIIYTLDYGLDPMQALRMPRLYPFTQNRAVQLEGGFGTEVISSARAAGYEIDPLGPTDMYFGGVHVIERRDGHWIGAADPRRNGEVRGY